MATQMDETVNNGMDIPKWMIQLTSNSILCQKDLGKGSAVDNYWPILCFSLMWKLMTRIIADSIYEYLEIHNLLPVEKKCCRRNNIGTKDKFLTDKMVLNDCKKRHTDLELV